jgi:hypothetical protein
MVDHDGCLPKRRARPMRGRVKGNEKLTVQELEFQIKGTSCGHCEPLTAEHGMRRPFWFSFFKTSVLCRAWCGMAVIPVHRRQRQEDCRFKASLGCTAKLCPFIIYFRWHWCLNLGPHASKAGTLPREVHL